MTYICLSTLPIVALPLTNASPDQEKPYSTTLNCLLHVSELQEGHCLAVSCKGRPIEERREGKKTVFSWQLQTPLDEVRIGLCQQGAEIAFWRGVWIPAAIFHLGDLPVHVFLNGQEQPGEATTQANNEAMPDTLLSTDRSPMRVPHENLVTLKASVSDFLSNGHVIPSEPETLPAPEQERAEDQQVEDDEDQEEEEFDEDDEAVFDEHEDDEDLTVPPAITHNAVVEAKAPGPKVAAFHAGSGTEEQQLAALQALVAVMPRKTVVVDLTERTASRAKSEAYSPFSQAYLRDVFGASYWDRSTSITTTTRLAPAAQGQSIQRVQRVVTNSDHPAGIASLEHYLHLGYSMVILDARASYEESVRRAVIEALRFRIPDLDCGPLS